MREFIVLARKRDRFAWSVQTRRRQRERFHTSTKALVRDMAMNAVSTLEDKSMRTDVRRHSYRTMAVLVDLMLLDVHRERRRSLRTVKWVVGFAALSVATGALICAWLLN